MGTEVAEGEMSRPALVLAIVALVKAMDGAAILNPRTWAI